MKGIEIFEKVIEILKDIDIFGGRVFQGRYTRTTTDVFPAVWVDVDSNQTEDEMPEADLGVRQVTMRMIIAASIMIEDTDKQVVGDSTHPGTLDIEEAIKKAIYSEFPSLGGLCLTFKLSTIDTDEKNYPVKTIIMNMDIEYLEDIND